MTLGRIRHLEGVAEALARLADRAEQLRSRFPLAWGLYGGDQHLATMRDAVAVLRELADEERRRSRAPVAITGPTGGDR